MTRIGHGDLTMEKTGVARQALVSRLNVTADESVVRGQRTAGNEG
jgi:hypothetical protein